MLEWQSHKSDISEFRLSANELRSVAERQHLSELSKKIDRRIVFQGGKTNEKL